MLLAPIPWAGRTWALPFLTALCPSERYSAERHRRHKTLTDWARQMLLQVSRWLPGRLLVVVADSSFAALELQGAVRSRLTVITRLRLDAALFDPAPLPTGRAGRPASQGRASAHPQGHPGRHGDLMAIPDGGPLVWRGRAPR